MPKSRIFNIMQYETHPETGDPLLNVETIEKAIAHKTITRWAWVCHDKDVYSENDEMNNPDHVQGDIKPRHFHIVLEMKVLTEIHTIAKWFGISDNFVDIVKGAGAFLDCVEYLTHESEKQQALGKYRYDDAEVNASEGFNFRRELDRRAERKMRYGKDLSAKDQQRYDVLYNGKTLRQCIAEDRLLYMEDIDRLKKLRMEYISTQKPPTTRMNYYISGMGGAGKGLISRAIARSLYPDLVEDEDIFFEVGAKGSTFEGYDGQPVIIWNDRRSFDLLQELGGRGNVFNVFDTHPTRQKQNVKFSAVSLCNAVNIVNSVEPYTDFLNGLAGEYKSKDGTEHKTEDKGQSYRRFPMIIPLHESDFDILLNRGFMENTGAYTEYIEYKNIVGNMQRIREICGPNEELAKRIETQTVKPIVDKHTELLKKSVETTANEDEILQQFSDYGKPDVLKALGFEEITPPFEVF